MYEIFLSERYHLLVKNMMEDEYLLLYVCIKIHKCGYNRMLSLRTVVPFLEALISEGSEFKYRCFYRDNMRHVTYFSRCLYTCVCGTDDAWTEDVVLARRHHVSVLGRRCLTNTHMMATTDQWLSSWTMH